VISPRVLIVLSPLLLQCTYEEDPDPRPGRNSHTLEILQISPGPGQVDVARNTTIDLQFNWPLDASSVSRWDGMLLSGLYQIFCTQHIDLLQQRLRLTPTTPLRAGLRYRVWVDGTIRALNGTTLGQDMYYDFTTGSRVRHPMEPPPPKVFAKDLQPLWDARCTSCHSKERPTAGVDLSSPAAVLRSLVNVPSSAGNKERVRPLYHAGSYLMYKLLHKGGHTGFPMPQQGTRLSATELRSVADWIDGGSLP